MYTNIWNIIRFVVLDTTDSVYSIYIRCMYLDILTSYLLIYYLHITSHTVQKCECVGYGVVGGVRLAVCVSESQALCWPAVTISSVHWRL